MEVGGQVLVAQAEPRLAAVAVEGRHGRPRLTGQAPARLGVDGTCQRVGDGVEVGADVQPVEHDVVAGVDDCRDLLGRHDAEQARQHAGGSDAAGERNDHRATLDSRDRAAA